MKKLLAISLAALMIMGVGVNAFAAVYEPTDHIVRSSNAVLKSTAVKGVGGIATAGFLEHENMVNIYNHTSGSADSVYEIQSGAVAPGQTIYVPLINNESGSENFVTEADAVKSASVKATYTLGRDYVSSIKIVYKKYNLDQATAIAAGLDGAGTQTTGYAYFLAITMKDSTSTAARDVAFDVTIKKSSGTLGGTNAAFELDASIALVCSYPRMEDNSDQYEITSAFQVFDSKNIGDGDQTFSFSKDPDSYFEVNTTGQDKILLKADVAYNATIAAKFPAANLDFFTGSGSFNKIGTLYLAAEPHSYLYVLNSDGSLSKSTAKYDSSQECFEIRTRTLGSYVISDRELNVSSGSEAPIVSSSQPSEAPSPAPSLPPVTGGDYYSPKPNPGTGVAA